MSTIADVPTEGTSPARSRSIVSTVRLAVFALAGLLLVGLNVALTPPEVLLAAVTGWDGAFGTHQVHDLTISAVLWVALLIPVALLAYRPRARVNAVLAPLLVAVPVAVFAFLAESPLFVGFAISSALAIALVLLHPAGRSLLRLDRVERIDRLVAAVYAVGALPMLAYGLLEFGKQVGPVDEHALFVHYGAMGIAGVLIAVMGGLAVLRRRDWRYAVASAGVIAAFVGLVSIFYPTFESSLGVVGGSLLIVWAAAFVGSVTYTRRGGRVIPEVVEESTPRTA